MRNTGWGRAAGAVVLAAFLGAAVPPAPAQGLRSVVIATVTSINHVPEFAAAEKGMFARRGGDVKLRVLNSGAETMRALQGGDAQFVTASPTTLASAWNAGLSLTAIITIMGDATRVFDDDMFAITAHPGSGIRRLHVEDLVGKRVGMVLGGTGEEYLRAVLARRGIAADRISFVNVPAPNHVSVMRSGGVDAEVTWEPYGTMILQQVPGAYVVLRGGGSIGYSLFMATDGSYITRPPDAVGKIVPGLAEAAWDVRHHEAESALIATRRIEGLDPASAKKAITSMAFESRISATTLWAGALEVQALVEHGRIRRALDLAHAVDTSFLDRAMREEPQAFADLKLIR